MRFLAQRIKNHLKHFFVSRYVVVWCVLMPSRHQVFVIDEAKYFISYPLPCRPRRCKFLPARFVAVPQKVFSQFFILRAPDFSSKRKRTFAGLSLNEQGGASLQLGRGGIPHTPSAAPSRAKILRWLLVLSLPLLPARKRLRNS